MALPFEDYGLIGDTHTAALVGRNGSIDWLCLPRFDSGACFAALLGEARHGRWIISPATPTRATSRRYRPHTLILETHFETTEGAVRVIDFMTPRSGEPDVIRIVEGVRGELPMEMELVIRIDYGSIVPWVRTIDDHLQAVAGPDALLRRGTSRTHMGRPRSASNNVGDHAPPAGGAAAVLAFGITIANSSPPHRARNGPRGASHR